MDATIDQIDTAAFATLQALARDASHTTRPFALVARAVQEPTFAGGQFSYDGQTLARHPACLWRLAGETADDDVRTMDGDAETRGRLRFQAWVVLRDPRTDQLRAKGGTSTAGLYGLVDEVIGALNNAPLESATAAGDVNELLRVHRLRYAGMTPRFSDATSTAVEVAFEAQRSVPTVAPTMTTVDVVDLRADVNLQDGAGADPSDADALNPLAQVDADAT